MIAKYLLPNRYKIPGWILLIIGLLFGIYFMATEFESDIFKLDVFAIYNNDDLFSDNSGFFKIIEDNSIVDEIVALCIILGGFLVGFSKEKVEDEFIYKLRNDSLVWAIVLNYLILAFAILFIYGFTFFDILVYNMFTPLLFYVFRFNFLKYRS